jgi:cell division protein FtsW
MRGVGKEHPGGLTAALGRIPTASILGVLVGALCLFGLVMVGSASESASISTYGSPWAILIREGMWMAIGLVALAVALRTDYRRWRRLGGILMVVSFVLLLAVLIPGIGVHSGGSSRWIGFGQFRLQPSELMKLAMVLFGADLVIRRE